MNEIVRHLGEINSAKPERFSKRSEASLLQEKPLEELEGIFVSKSVELLRHPELHALVDEGKVTLGMVKPNTYEGKDLPSDDDEAVQQVLSEIEGVFFSIPVEMTPLEAEEFYRPTVEALRRSGKEDIAESIIEFTSSSPLTVFLKADSDNAVANWRAQMGPTRMEDFTKPEHANTLRGKYAKETGNNIVHGSDSIESAHREIYLLADMLEARLPINTF